MSKPLWVVTVVIQGEEKSVVCETILLGENWLRRSLSHVKECRPIWWMMGIQGRI
jgi:hypothetical protein